MFADTVTESGFYILLLITNSLATSPNPGFPWVPLLYQSRAA